MKKMMLITAVTVASLFTSLAFADLGGPLPSDPNLGTEADKAAQEGKLNEQAFCPTCGVNQDMKNFRDLKSPNKTETLKTDGDNSAKPSGGTDNSGG